MRGHQLHRVGIAVLHHLAHGQINAGGGGIGAVAAGHQVAAQEHLLVAGFQGELPHFAHAETGNHLAGDRGHLLNVATGAGGHLGVAEHHILGGTAAKGTHDPGAQLGATHQHLLLIGREPGEALGLAARNQGDLLHGVVGLHQGSHQGVPNLVVGDQALTATIGERFALHAGNDPIHRVVDLGEGGGLLAAAGGEDRRLVEQVGQIRTGEPGGSAGDRFETHIFGKLLVAGVHLEHREAALDVGHVHLHLTVEATGAQQG